MEKLVLVPYDKYQRLLDAQTTKHLRTQMRSPTTPSTRKTMHPPRESDKSKKKRSPSTQRNLYTVKDWISLSNCKNPCHIRMSRMQLSSVYNRIHYLVALREAPRDDRITMLQNITRGQLDCIGEIARRIYDQTYPLLERDLNYFEDRSLLLRVLFAARISFRRKKAVLVRYHMTIIRLYDPTIFKPPSRIKSVP